MRARVRASVCVPVSVRVSLCVRARARIYTCKGAGAVARSGASVRMCGNGSDSRCAKVRVRVQVRACVRACVRALDCARMGCANAVDRALTWSRRRERAGASVRLCLAEGRSARAPFRMRAGGRGRERQRESRPSGCHCRPVPGALAHWGSGPHSVRPRNLEPPHRRPSGAGAPVRVDQARAKVRKGHDPRRPHQVHGRRLAGAGLPRGPRPGGDEEAANCLLYGRGVGRARHAAACKGRQSGRPE